MSVRCRLGWLPLVNRAIFLRATIIAGVIGSVLTLINQSGWVAGTEPLQLLPLILVFLTPFAVVTIAQCQYAAGYHGTPRINTNQRNQHNGYNKRIRNKQGAAA